jgi:flagellar L-ring protein precursor FlgH
MRIWLGALALLSLVSPLPARDKNIQKETLDAYIQRMQQQPFEAGEKTCGSLWNDHGRFANVAADYKAMQVGDLVTILVVHDVQAANSGNVSTDRSFKASSGIDALGGNPSTAAIQNLFSPHSAATLAGKAQASSTSSLRTRLAGRVVAVLANGMLVVEAERQITMNNERQTVALRGLVRPGDIAPDNSIASNAIGNLELELKGKGVVSDGTRPPNPVMRILLRIVGF